MIELLFTFFMYGLGAIIATLLFIFIIYLFPFIATLVCSLLFVIGIGAIVWFIIKLFKGAY